MHPYFSEEEEETFEIEIPWLGFVDVTSATLASVLVLVMVFGLSAAITMAAIEESERELFTKGLIYPFDEYRDYVVSIDQGWRERVPQRELVYSGSWGVPVLAQSGDKYIYDTLQKWNAKELNLVMEVSYNPRYTFRGAVLEAGYEQVNEIRKTLAGLNIRTYVRINTKTTTRKQIGEIKVTIKRP